MFFVTLGPSYRSNLITRELGLKTTIAFEAPNGGWMEPPF